MELHTSAAVITYLSNIEKEAAAFYEKWAEKNDEFAEIFRRYAAENRKHAGNVKRSYYSVISDMLETGFAYQGLCDDVAVPALDGAASAEEVLKSALDLEGAMKDFYSRAAEMSEGTMADVPRTMKRVVSHREKRIKELNERIGI